MTMTILPKTKPGKWSLWLAISVPVLFAMSTYASSYIYVSYMTTGSIAEDILQRPLLSIPAVLGMASGIAAFITGLVAIFKRKDRAILVFLPTLVGALMLVFIIGEVLSGE